MRNVTLSLGSVALVVALAIPACHDSSSPTEPLSYTGRADYRAVASIRILPDTEDIRVGERIRLRLELRNAYGRLLDARPVQWGSTEPATATVDGTGLITGVAAGRTRIFAQVEGKADSSFLLVTGPAGPPVWYISLTPDTIRLNAGDSLRTSLELRDSRRRLLGNRAVTWRSLAPDVARIDTTGLVTAVGIGLGQVFATSEGLADTSVVMVGAAPVAVVRIVPDSASVAVGRTVQLATSIIDGTGAPIGGRPVAWSTLDAQLVTVDSTGKVTGVAVGRGRVVATSDGAADTAVVVVSRAPVASVVVQPDTATLVAGGTLRLTSTMRDAGGAVLPGRTVAWRSLQPAIATTDDSGRVTAVVPGVARIVAESEGVADTARITVVPPRVASVVVSPDSASIVAGATVRLTATARDAAGAELTGRQLLWRSLQLAIARVDSGGLVTGLAAGVAHVVAASEGQADTATITVAPRPVASVTVLPDTATIDVAQRLRLTATLRDASGTELTGRQVAWRSLQAAVATVSGSGEVSGIAAGQARIVAESEGRADTSRITVVAPQPPAGPPVARVSLQPDFLNVVERDTARLRLRLRDANLNTIPIAGRVVVWTSMSPSIARVDSTGLVTGVSFGQTRVYATSEGRADTSTVTVDPIAPPPPPPPPPPTTTGPAGDPTLLPVAARQLPDYAAYPGRTTPAGQSYQDPVTNVRVWRVTDPATPVANSQAYHDYAAGPVQISRDWGSEQHTLLVMAGGYRLVDFTRGQGFANWRRAPATNGDLSFSFALNPATPRIAYFVQGRTLHRYDTQTMQLANTGHFPKDLSAVAPNSLSWLQQDRLDEWFVMMATNTTRVIAWNSRTDQVRTIDVPNLDEPHLEKDGRYVALLTGGGSAPIWDLATGSTRTLAVQTPHLEALRGYFVSWFPSWTAGPQYYANAATGQVVTTLQAAQLSPDNMHRAGQWVQNDDRLPGGSLLKQWFLWSGFGDGIVTPNGWSVHAGQIHASSVAWNPMYQKPSIGVRSVRQTVAGDPTRIARQLTPVASLAAMTEGSFFYDAGSQRVYVWLEGGGNPSGRVELRAPGTVHDGIGFVRVDGSEVRLLAHTYQLYRAGQYWQLPRATVSPDGKIVLFESNMNDADGRADVFLVEVPAR